MTTAQAASTEARILHILSQLTTLPPERIRPQDRLVEDLGLDSVTRLELISMLVEEFDMDVELEDAVAVDDVAGIFAMAHERLGDA
ncbi:MAG: acyl carrier protein [Deltaproteobacteria bacterium]|nr:MAG: acyl carrier protein [Deltaproteobacteria bacterium]